MKKKLRPLSHFFQNFPTFFPKFPNFSENFQTFFSKFFGNDSLVIADSVVSQGRHIERKITGLVMVDQDQGPVSLYGDW